MAIGIQQRARFTFIDILSQLLIAAAALCVNTTTDWTEWVDPCGRNKRPSLISRQTINAVGIHFVMKWAFLKKNFYLFAHSRHRWNMKKCRKFNASLKRGNDFQLLYNMFRIKDIKKKLVADFTTRFQTVVFFFSRFTKDSVKIVAKEEGMTRIHKVLLKNHVL